MMWTMVTADMLYRTGGSSRIRASGRCSLQAAAVLICLGLMEPASASAAGCSDYANQAAAQRAADTREVDGDGI